MSKPISQFGYLVNDLEVAFTSLSLNTDDLITTYLWDFGDGNTSTEKDPVHTYLTESFFTVSLEVTNSPTEIDSSNTVINLTTNPDPVMFYDIPAMVDLYAPTFLVGTVKKHDQKEFLIAKWQNYLQPLVIDPKVTPENTYNPSVWAPLANALIAKLVVIDILIMDASAFVLNTANQGASIGNSSSTGGGTPASNGGIKSIETGPTKVERFENKDASSGSEATMNLSRAYQSLSDEGGVLDQLKNSACQEAQRLLVFLPMCGQLPLGNSGFIISKRIKQCGCAGGDRVISQARTKRGY